LPPVLLSNTPLKKKNKTKHPQTTMAPQVTPCYCHRADAVVHAPPPVPSLRFYIIAYSLVIDHLPPPRWRKRLFRFDCHWSCAGEAGAYPVIATTTSPQRFASSRLRFSPPRTSPRLHSFTAFAAAQFDRDSSLIFSHRSSLVPPPRGRSTAVRWHLPTSLPLLINRRPSPRTSFLSPISSPPFRPAVALTYFCLSPLLPLC
jgi:hypothetical protein